jgi:hypothetical protein
LIRQARDRLNAGREANRYRRRPLVRVESALSEPVVGNTHSEQPLRLRTGSPHCKSEPISRALRQVESIRLKVREQLVVRLTRRSEAISDLPLGEKPVVGARGWVVQLAQVSVELRLVLTPQDDCQGKRLVIRGFRRRQRSRSL